MNMAEFRAWKAETEKSRTQWTLDECMMQNGTAMFYIGGESGKYICVTQDGQASLGTYEGAVPHIGEALFRATWTRKFATKDEALTYVLERGGMHILLALTHGRSPWADTANGRFN